MNICFVVYSHYSRDARVRRYVQSLAAKGFKVDVICLKEDYHPKENNIYLIKYPINRRRQGRLWYIFEYLFFFLYSLIILSYNQIRKNYKLIHVNNMPDFLVFSAIISKILGTKIILDMHDPMPELYMSKFQKKENGFTVKCLKWLEKQSMMFADHVLTANENFKTIFLNRKSCTADKTSVILNCPDPKIFSIKHHKSNLQQFNLLYMGTVDKRFGLNIVLEAMPLLIKRIPDIRFTIIPKITGEGKYFNNLKLEIGNWKLEKYILIKNPQPLENIVSEINMADIGIVLAKDGIFTDNIIPVKLLEFIQMGVPVIATKTKILSKYFSDQQLSFLKKNTPEEFARTVRQLYKNRTLRSKFSVNAKKYLEKYNWKNEERKYLEIISSMIKSK